MIATPSSPRIPGSLIRTMAELARRGLTPAEIRREAGSHASRIGCARPSYESVRLLVVEIRSSRRPLDLLV